MKINGSNGGISRTLQFQVLMGIVEAVLGSLQLIEDIMTPTQFVVLFFVLAVIQKAGNTYLRTKTIGPLK